jgi:hypothetical protein
MQETIRNRIKGHRRVRAGELVPHEWNFRLHPEGQKSALEAVYREVGFARSLLAFELPDGRLKLIDGHLRRDLDPDMEVDVEILDVDEEEARTLLLSIDPLAALAETQQQLHDRLMEVTPTSSEELKTAWREAVEEKMREWGNGPDKSVRPTDPGPEQWLVLVTCRDEGHQLELLERFEGEGLEAKALMA